MWWLQVCLWFCDRCVFSLHECCFIIYSTLKYLAIRSQIPHIIVPTMYPARSYPWSIHFYMARYFMGFTCWVHWACWVISNQFVLHSQVCSIIVPCNMVPMKYLLCMWLNSRSFILFACWLHWVIGDQWIHWTDVISVYTV